MIDPAALGATLYVPATRPDLAAIACGARWPMLRSVVFCLEDAVHARDVGAALAGLRGLAAGLRATRAAHPHGPLLFVRPRAPAMLAEIVGFPGVASFDGFVIPKATADSLPDWLAALPFAHHLLMPTLETRDAFDGHEMRRLRDQLLAIHERVLAVRIGGNDLLQTIGARRSAIRTAYDGPLGAVIAALVTTFAPWGFALSAPVLERFDDPALLAEEVARDLDHGLVTKTAIHPHQVAAIHAAYAVAEADWRSAEAMLAADAPAVFASNGLMCEPSTHHRWAAATLRRAELFGIVRADPELLLVG